MEAISKGRFLKFSSSKAMLVADMIRGKDVEEARGMLRFCPKGCAPMLLKILNSAVANANTNAKLNVDNLFVKEIFINQGPTLKRIMTRGMGRANRILKRSCHVTVVLAERETGR